QPPLTLSSDEDPEPLEVGHSSTESNGWRTPNSENIFIDVSDTEQYRGTSHSYRNYTTKRQRNITELDDSSGDSDVPTKDTTPLGRRILKRPKFSQ
ncbi:hypothetical protein GIB67_022628, partial [Kingdonia uniflora]